MTGSSSGSNVPNNRSHDDEDAAVVAVDVLPVAAVVDPMVRRGVEHLLERTELPDRVGVDPVLVEEVDAACLRR